MRLRSGGCPPPLPPGPEGKGSRPHYNHGTNFLTFLTSFAPKVPKCYSADYGQESVLCGRPKINHPDHIPVQVEGVWWRECPLPPTVWEFESTCREIWGHGAHFQPFWVVAGMQS